MLVFQFQVLVIRFKSAAPNTTETVGRPSLPAGAANSSVQPLQTSAQLQQEAFGT